MRHARVSKFLAISGGGSIARQLFVWRHRTASALQYPHRWRASYRWRSRHQFWRIRMKRIWIEEPISKLRERALTSRY